MPLQNRVDLLGQLHAVPETGQWMGNRGRLHDADRSIIGQIRISCTYLFILDEGIAYSAPRLCAEGSHDAFTSLWAKIFPEQKDLAATAIDRVLNAAHLSKDDSKRTSCSHLGALHSHLMIEHETKCLLLWEVRPWMWSFEMIQPITPPQSNRPHSGQWINGDRIN